jgi:hypothetical protein
MDRVIKRRNMLLQVILMVVTFGIYGVYWFYVTCAEMKAIAKDSSAAPGLWTFLLFIPFANIFAMYKQGCLYERVASDHMNRWIVFILWFVFSPAVWFIIQSELNKRATAETSSAVLQQA